MKNFLKKNYKKILGVLVVAGILAFAFWYGGSAPGARGFSVKKDETAEIDKDDDSAKTQEQDTQTANENKASNIDEKEAQESQPLDEKTSEGLKEASPEDKPGNSDINSDKTEEASPKKDSAADKNSSDKNSSDNKSSSDNSNNVSDKTGSGFGNKDTGKGNIGDANSNSGSGDKNSDAAEKKNTCTVSISCKTILDNMDILKESKKSCVPSSGVILSSTTVEVSEGDSIFEILKKVTKEKGIQLEYSYTGVYGNYYIEGINNIYEFDCGELSGWMYSVNNQYPSFGSSDYVVKDGDNIRWLFTCNLGEDLR